MALWPELASTPHVLRWVDAKGVKTRCLEAGPADGPPLLMLHGTGGHLETYIRNIAPAAHAGFRVLAIDMLGHGYTDKPDFDYDIPAHIQHTLAFLDAMGIGRAHVSGESLGGWVAARLAVLHPDRVARLVLNTPGGRTFNEEANNRLRDLSLKAAREPNRQNVRKRLEWLMHDPATVTDDLVETRYRIYLQPEFADAMAHICVLLLPGPRRANMISDDELRAIKAPTLVIWTSHDPQGAVEVGKVVADLIPRSDFHVMQNCGHWPQFEDAATFNRLQLEFLKA
jgi:2-hydroxy-6-oxonona-2,4-dienedioate hydrolase